MTLKDPQQGLSNKLIEELKEASSEARSKLSMKLDKACSKTTS